MRNAARRAPYGLLVLGGSIVLAQPLPYPKPRTGQCAGDYRQSGGYCVPKTERSRPAIPKQPGAQCPAGWRSGASSCTKEER